MILGLVVGFMAGACVGGIVLSLLAASNRNDERTTVYERELQRRGLK